MGDMTVAATCVSKLYPVEFPVRLKFDSSRESLIEAATEALLSKAAKGVGGDNMIVYRGEVLAWHGSSGVCTPSGDHSMWYVTYTNVQGCTAYYVGTAPRPAANFLSVIDGCLAHSGGATAIWLNGVNLLAGHLVQKDTLGEFPVRVPGDS